MSNYGSSIRPPVWGLGWTLGVKNGANRNVVHTLLFDVYTHYRPILHRLATIHNAVDRQIEVGRLCYSIGGLTTLSWSALQTEHSNKNAKNRNVRLPRAGLHETRSPPQWWSGHSTTPHNVLNLWLSTMIFLLQVSKTMFKSTHFFITSYQRN